MMVGLGQLRLAQPSVGGRAIFLKHNTRFSKEGRIREIRPSFASGVWTGRRRTAVSVRCSRALALSRISSSVHITDTAVK
jgi:hypothetical protein